MNAAQGVLLLMMAALALYLLWNSKSPFNSPTNIIGGAITKPSPQTDDAGNAIGDDEFIGPVKNPPNGLQDVKDAFSCALRGGYWDYKGARCLTENQYRGSKGASSSHSPDISTEMPV